MLDNLKQIKKLDKSNMLGSLQLLGKQIEQIWNGARDLKVPASYKNIQNVAVFGMGGSTLGVHVIKTLFSGELKVPVDIINDYHAPKFVNSKTLAILSSYSGNTEEVVNAMKECKAKRAKIAVISAGGKLKTMAKRHKAPALIFSTENNPCGSPRMGLGYSIVGQIVLFAKAGILKLSQKQVKQMIKTIACFDTGFGALTPGSQNIAKQLAKKVMGKSVWYAASEHMVGNAHLAANQMNENGKRFAGYFALPEMDHHLIEGLVYPASHKKDILFVFIESGLYDKRVQRRYQVTKRVLQKNKINFVSYKCKEKDKLLQMSEVLVLSSYLSYYCALLKGLNPTPIPYVDFLKKQLAK